MISKLADIAQITHDPEAIERLRNTLIPLGIEFRRVLANTPTEITLSERLAWIDKNVLDPLITLLGALEPQHRSMFSLWPEEVVDDLMPDFDETVRRLEHLQLLGRNVAIVLAAYRHYDLPFGQLIKYRIVAAAAETIDRALPSLVPSRGTYDQHTKSFNGIYPDLIRAIYREITGQSEQLDGLIREQVEIRRK